MTPPDTLHYAFPTAPGPAAHTRHALTPYRTELIRRWGELNGDRALIERVGPFMSDAELERDIAMFEEPDDTGFREAAYDPVPDENAGHR